jgi:anti-sigma regulatory factor (Ser/Thr protein kinase)/serine/threonine protein phosphatase PrpC
VEKEVIVVSYTSDNLPAQQMVRKIASQVGFDATSIEELAVVISELVTNLVKHAGGGKITITSLDANGRVGIQIESDDDGAGIANFEQAMTDGFSTAGSLGYGLGTVNRLMDRMDIATSPEKGFHLICQRWLRTTAFNQSQIPLDIGVATRPKLGFEDNGDSFVIKHWGQSVLTGVIDGLGHGNLAHYAAETARNYVETHYDQPMARIFSGVAHDCRATRGVVMALARFDFLQPTTPEEGPPFHLTYANIGNVECRVLNSPQPVNLILRRGVLGGVAPNPVINESPWHNGNIMVLHSDGLTTRWRWEDFPDLGEQSAAITSQKLIQALAKEEDDATVLVVKTISGGSK